MSYEIIRENHAQATSDLLKHLAAAEELKTEEHRLLLEACETLATESQEGMSLRYLKHCARVTDWGRTRLTPSEIAARRGPYPYYGRGSEIAYIDDFSFTESSLLVGCRGAVSTLDGKFFVVTSEGKHSVSELFHIVLPAEGDFDYVRLCLEARDAARYVKGPKEARFIELCDLCNVLIPWPSKKVRDAYVAAHKHCENAGLYETRSLVRALWNANARLVENIQASEDPQLADTPDERPEAARAEGDHGALAVAERLLDIIAPSDSAEIHDVVAATSDLADPNIPVHGDYLVCFPSPNQGEWTKVRVNEKDPRWILGVPPRNKANFAWIQQTIACMNEGATALLLLCNAPLHSEIGREKANRTALAQCGLLDAVVSLPGGIFDDKRPPSSLLVLKKGRPTNAPTLLIDASNEGDYLNLAENGLVTRELPAAAIELVADTYQKWISGDGYLDMKDFCREVRREEIAERGYLLSPWAYV